MQLQEQYASIDVSGSEIVKLEGFPHLKNFRYMNSTSNILRKIWFEEVCLQCARQKRIAETVGLLCGMPGFVSVEFNFSARQSWSLFSNQHAEDLGPPITLITKSFSVVSLDLFSSFHGLASGTASLLQAYYKLRVRCSANYKLYRRSC